MIIIICRGLEVSLISPLEWIKNFLPELRKANGRILYTSSSALKSPLPAWSGFTSPRAAMNQILASLAKEEPKIVGLAVEPGVMNTEAFAAAFKELQKSMPPEYVKWFESVQKSPNFLNPEIPAEAFAKLILNAPKSKAGTFCSWNEPWIKDLADN